MTLRHRIDKEELMRSLAKSLEAHKMPDDVRILESMPVSRNGKLDRVAIAANFSGNA